jgi:hypothetical protein
MCRVARLTDVPTPAPPPLSVKKSQNVRWIDVEQAKLRRYRVRNIYPLMSWFLTMMLGSRMRKDNLLKIAAVIAHHRNVKVDRLAQRTKDMLIVWFCENAFEFVSRRSDPIFVAALASVSPPPVQTPPDSLSLSYFVAFGERTQLSVEEDEFMHGFLY